MLESSLQTKVLDYLNSLPHCVAENVSGNARQRGRADINGCYKGRSLRIELKSPTTKYSTTKQQELNMLRWEKAGAVVGTCRSLSEVKKLLKEIDNGE